MTLIEFIDQFDDFTDWSGQQQVDLLAYFLEVFVGQPSFSAKEIDECFDLLKMKRYSRTGPYLSENANSRRGGKYIKVAKEYGLERGTLESIRKRVEHEPKQIRVSQQLSDLLVQVADPQEQKFLEEAINCYRVRAFRATIILVWMLVVHRLEEFVYTEKLPEFNAALAKNPDKRVKVIGSRDDFADLQESKLIELLRASDIITNDVRKILDEKLGVRNSAAHPSALTFDGHKATEFTSDLVNNVLLKFQSNKSAAAILP